MERKEYTVQELLDLAHKYKCARIKVGPIELELSPAAFGEPADLKTGGEKIPSPEEFMFMAGLQVEQEERPKVGRRKPASRPVHALPPEG
jgi:hypothetical protein